MITKIYHKKNELFQVEFYQDEKCQQAFDFENIKNLYIELKDGDCTPIFSLSNKLWSLNIKANIFTPTWYLGLYDGISPQTPLITLNDVLDDIDLSKYIPENNAVLFLSEEDKEKYCNTLLENVCIFSLKDLETWEFKYLNDFGEIETPKKATIFLTHGTEAELKTANEIAQELKERYGVDEVNLFVLHCFGYLYGDDYIIVGFKKENNFNTRLILDEFIDKVIATNSTGISEPQDEKRLQILDCYDIFNDYLEGE
jgi:hypothetical protein